MDGRIEFNTLINEQKEEIIASTIFNDLGCINIMEMNEKENYLLCGTNNGGMLHFHIDKKKIELKDNKLIHTDKIVSISINDNLNMFATSSCIYLYGVLRAHKSSNLGRDRLRLKGDFLGLTSIPLFNIY